MRLDKRTNNQFRPYSFERNFLKTAEGSVLVSCGDTKVLVTAKVSDKVPPFLDKEKNGWLTAEYAMLPGSCKERARRENKSGPSGRSSEIQRLIGRALRAMVDLDKFPGYTIHVDADVLQADGGTRTASISAAYVAVYDCLRYMKKEFGLFEDGLPLKNQIAAISVGIRNGEVLLDLNYEEDSSCDTDANFVMTSDLKIIEVQGTAEGEPFKTEDLMQMLDFAKVGIQNLCDLQNEALGLN
jgi:ribonuclease PH